MATYKKQVHIWNLIVLNKFNLKNKNTYTSSKLNKEPMVNYFFVLAGR